VALTHPQLLVCTALVIVALIVAVARLHVPAFIALLLASLAVGLCAGLNIGQIIKAFQEGVGNLLGSIAMIVGLGTVLGKLLAESGGAGDRRTNARARRRTLAAVDDGFARFCDRSGVFFAGTDFAGARGFRGA
jgi:4-amino-4-deoxy-L-arabinose transferase-like glycosyltransferase